MQDRRVRVQPRRERLLKRRGRGRDDGSGCLRDGLYSRVVQPRLDKRAAGVVAWSEERGDARVRQRCRARRAGAGERERLSREAMGRHEGECALEKCGTIEYATREHARRCGRRGRAHVAAITRRGGNEGSMWRSECSRARVKVVQVQKGLKVGNAIQIEAWSRRVMGEPNTLPPLSLPLSRGFARAARRWLLSCPVFYNFDDSLYGIDLRDHAHCVIRSTTYPSHTRAAVCSQQDTASVCRGPVLPLLFSAFVKQLYTDDDTCTTSLSCMLHDMLQSRVCTVSSLRSSYLSSDSLFPAEKLSESLVKTRSDICMALGYVTTANRRRRCSKKYVDGRESNTGHPLKKSKI
jgi:hypothetical protein